MIYEEVIIVLRDDYPIAYLDYKGYIMTNKLRKFNLIGDEELISCRINGDDFNKILKDLQFEMTDDLTKYFVWYFSDLSIVSTDVIVFTGA